MDFAYDKPITPKAINYREIKWSKDSVPHQLLEDVRKWHDDIAEARIGLAWRYKWKPSVDGRLTLGQCVKASDLQKEFSQFDFVIVLNYEAWHSKKWTDAMRLALLDHELCHATVALDAGDEVKYDEDNHPVFRLRKHDVEEFREIIDRHGCWKDDLRLLAETIKEMEPSLFEQSRPDDIEESIRASSANDSATSKQTVEVK